MPKRASLSPERGWGRGERGGKRYKQDSYNPSHRPSYSSSSSCSVFVGNLRYETRWQELKDHMRKAGNVDSVRRFFLFFFSLFKKKIVGPKLFFFTHYSHTHTHIYIYTG